MEEKKYRRRKRNRYKLGEDYDMYRERQNDNRKSDSNLSICDTNIDGA